MSVEMREVRTGCLRAGGVSLPLTRMEITGHLTGLLHRTRVCQTFVNDHEVPLEAVYIHPLPPKAAVHGFRMVIGDRVIQGQVQERAAARQAYAEAVAQGHRAALMEEERSDIFTTTVGNIAPGEQVSITFELSGPLEFLGSTASLIFPMVVPEVYISGAPVGGGNVGDGTAMDTGAVPDASRITPPRLAPGAANPVDLRLSFTVDPAGLELEKVESLCHFAKVRRRPDGCHEISLLPGMERMAHDFVVRLQLKEGSLQSTVIADPETGTLAVTIVPPLGAAAQAPPRDLVIVLDRSGSMQGFPMTAARRAASRMVESLTPRDRFALIAFDNSCELLEPRLIPADARNQQRAQEFLTGIQARGGTEARSAIDRALQMFGRESASDRTIVFVTDGDVGNDAELLVRSSSGVRISTVGIGCNSRQGVLERIAKTSGGLCTMIPDQSTLETALRELHLRLGRPHWMGVSIAGVTASAQTPRYWDVWEGVPTTFFAKASNLGSEVTLEGWWSSSGKFRESVPVCRRDDLVLHRSWARSRLLDLDDLWTVGKVQQQELVDLSVEAQVLCRFTAFTAIDESEIVQGADRMRTVVQPVEATLSQSAAMPAPVAARSAGIVRSKSAGSPGQAGGLRRSSSPGAPPVGGSKPMLARMSKPGPLGDKPSLGSRPSLSRSQPTPPSAPPMAPPPPSRPMSAPPMPSASRSEAPPSPPRPEAEVSKRRRPSTIWQMLLELLEQVAKAPRSEKAALLDRMVEALGDYCRKLSANSSEASTGKAVMSLLVDLKQAVEDGDDSTAPTTELRAMLESLDR